MSFSDQIQKFSDNAINEIEKKRRVVEINARNRLQELLLDEVREIKSIALDADIGKFYDVDAPASVLEKLRKADLLRD